MQFRRPARSDLRLLTPGVLPPSPPPQAHLNGAFVRQPSLGGSLSVGRDRFKSAVKKILCLACRGAYRSGRLLRVNLGHLARLLNLSAPPRLADFQSDDLETPHGRL